MRVASFLGGSAGLSCASGHGIDSHQPVAAPSLRPLTDVCFTVFAVSGHSEIRSCTTSHSPIGLAEPWRADRACFPERHPHLRWSETIPALLQWNLSTRAKPRANPFDRESMSEGKLVAVEGYTKTADEDRRFRWEDLPGKRPLCNQPNRLKLPPDLLRSSCANLESPPFVVNDQEVELPNSGRQPSDPALSRSFLRPRRCSPRQKASPKLERRSRISPAQFRSSFRRP